MLPIYLIVGLINIFAQNHNYGIKIQDPNFDVRVRRSLEDTAKPPPFFYSKKLKSDVFRREKRYAYYKKIIMPIDYKSRFNYTQGNSNNGSLTRNNGNRYDIFNPNWNFLLNTTRNSRNNGTNSGVNNGYNNRPIIRSYPYGYPPGYGPNLASGNNRINTTPGYRKQGNNTPYYFNYQNPNEQNSAGYGENTANKSGYNNITPGYNIAPGYNNIAPGYNNIAPGYNNVTPGYNNVTPRYNNVTPGYNTVTPGYNNNYNNAPIPYTPIYLPRPNNTNTNDYRPWNANLAPYPPNYIPEPINSNFSAVNNTGIYNLPYAPNHGNGVYNNIPTPFNNNNLSPYAPNFSPTTNNGSTTPNNTIAPNTPINNTLTVSTTTEKITIATGCVICNIPCPRFMRRLGGFCMPETADDDY